MRWFLALLLLSTTAYAQEVDPVARLKAEWQGFELASAHAADAVQNLANAYLAQRRELATAQAAADEQLYAERAAWAEQVQGLTDEITKLKER